MTDRIRSKVIAEPRPCRQQKRAPSPRPWFVRVRSLVWIPVIGGVVLAAMTLGTPHLRYRYSYTAIGNDPAARIYQRCDYLGLHSRRVIPAGGSCPVIVLLTARGED